MATSFKRWKDVPRLDTSLDFYRKHGLYNAGAKLVAASYR